MGYFLIEFVIFILIVYFSAYIFIWILRRLIKRIKRELKISESADNRTMPVPVYGIGDKTEAQELKTFLEDIGIPFEITPFSGYKYADIWECHNGWGILITQNQYALRIKNALQAYLKIKLEQARDSGIPPEEVIGGITAPTETIYAEEFRRQPTAQEIEERKYSQKFYRRIALIFVVITALNSSALICAILAIITLSIIYGPKKIWTRN
ncbi:MAG: hypothetical protein WC980_04725 [Candidatus Brocadiia bacterium]